MKDYLQACFRCGETSVILCLGFEDVSEIAYECSGDDIITEGFTCRYRVNDGSEPAF